MPTPLKDVYSFSFYDRFTQVLQTVLPSFSPEEFLSHIFAEGWEKKELKERMRHTAQVLHLFLPSAFGQAVPVLLHTIERLQEDNFPVQHVEFMFLPDYLEVYGQQDLDLSLQAMEVMTQFISCEFAIRPFLLQYPTQVLAQMQAWSLHEHPAVRRLASEGSRPRLPWAVALPFLKRDPAPLLPILENLKADPSDFVRRSVANHLNDISKDHPAVVLHLLTQWKGQNPLTHWILKHGCRTLLKQGHPEALRFFGYERDVPLALRDFQVLTSQVRVGQELRFSFVLKNTSGFPQKVRLEYGLYYQKANQSLARKVFKISEREFAPEEEACIIRRQSFKPISTRTFHLGPHRVSVIVNGQEREMADFTLVP
ncbi:DNA alkylation repair protein [Rufibacter glacialis]|uniref:DNA alkylation repair protein n=1 Tax=Rufibacter glacialis TaxID=1259555 RepID=A0A5M8QNY7_9BACT|nr:DNA alkylation repair protein [Rufibacter glacialis]KAA6437789.1 DNA alkylation repair protein [Rufibacter glacialis]